MRDTYDSHSNVDAPRRRRNRNNMHQRNYICACGKSYLSYPALYTHIKNKHQGQAPTSGQVAMSRNIQTYRINHKQQPESDHQRQLSKPDEALVATINCFRSYSATKQLNYTLKQIFAPFQQDFKKEIEIGTQSYLAGNSSELNNKITIDKIISKFLSLLMNKIDKHILIEFVLVLLIFRCHLNQYQFREHGKEYYTQQHHTAALGMLDTMNQFLLYYFNFILKKVKFSITSPTCFIGRNNRQFICVGRFMFLFGRWAYLEKYTNTKLRIQNF